MAIKRQLSLGKRIESFVMDVGNSYTLDTDNGKIWGDDVSSLKNAYEDKKIKEEDLVKLNIFSEGIGSKTLELIFNGLDDEKNPKFKVIKTGKEFVYNGYTEIKYWEKI